MPNALIQYMGYLIYFWGGDGSEPVHVHVSKSKQKNATKFWVTSEGIELANDTGSVDKKDMKAILAYLRANSIKENQRPCRNVRSFFFC